MAEKESAILTILRFENNIFFLFAFGKYHISYPTLRQI